MDTFASSSVTRFSSLKLVNAFHTHSGKVSKENQQLSGRTSAQTPDVHTQLERACPTAGESQVSTTLFPEKLCISWWL